MRAIDYYVMAHATLDQPGINNLGDIRIGVTGISPSGSETERLMVALDNSSANCDYLDPWISPDPSQPVARCSRWDTIPIVVKD